MQLDIFEHSRDVMLRNDIQSLPQPRYQLSLREQPLRNHVRSLARATSAA